MRLNSEEKLILACVKIHPEQADLETINSLIPRIKNWERLIKNIIANGLGPLLYKKLPYLSNRNLLPDFAERRIYKSYLKTLSKNIKLYNAFEIVIKKFQQQNIPVIALKGIYLAENFYKDLSLRQMSDIDLLIHEEDKDLCFDILDELGFYPYDGIRTEETNGHSKDLIHYKARINKQEISVELHIKIHHLNENYFVPVEELWNNKVQIPDKNYLNVYSLDFNHNLIHLILHLDKHFKSGHIQFTCFIDLVNILNEYIKSMDWAELGLLCKNYRCESIIFKYVILANRYFGIDIPETIHNEYKKLLRNETSKLFIRYICGYTIYKTFVSEYIIDLKSVTESKLKISYLLLSKLFFPPKSFLKNKYKIKYDALLVFYYPYLWSEGIFGLIIHIINRRRKKKLQ